MPDRSPKNKLKMKCHRSGGNGNGNGNGGGNGKTAVIARNHPGDRVRREKPYWCTKTPNSGNCQKSWDTDPKCERCPIRAAALVEAGAD